MAGGLHRHRLLPRHPAAAALRRALHAPLLPGAAGGTRHCPRLEGRGVGWSGRGVGWREGS
eukprot:102962-Prymnesium_polylepis.1